MSDHYPEFWGPERNVSCVCGGPWPCPNFIPGAVTEKPMGRVLDFVKDGPDKDEEKDESICLGSRGDAKTKCYNCQAELVGFTKWTRDQLSFSYRYDSECCKCGIPYVITMNPKDELNLAMLEYQWFGVCWSDYSRLLPGLLLRTVLDLLKKRTERVPFPSGMNWSEIRYDRVATETDDHGFLVDTLGGPITLTLPVSPREGQQVSILDKMGTFERNNFTVKSHKKIQGVNEDLVCDISGSVLSLCYSSGSGWTVSPGGVASGAELLTRELSPIELLRANKDVVSDLLINMIDTLNPMEWSVSQQRSVEVGGGRRSGRTAALMLRCLAEACLNPGSPVEFVDHSGYSQNMESRRQNTQRLRDMAERLGLLVEITSVGRAIVVKSTLRSPPDASFLRRMEEVWGFDGPSGPTGMTGPSGFAGPTGITGPIVQDEVTDTPRRRIRDPIDPIRSRESIFPANAEQLARSQIRYNRDRDVILDDVIGDGDA